jgi:hypothetical protein
MPQLLAAGVAPLVLGFIGSVAISLAVLQQFGCAVVVEQSRR